MLMRNSIGAAMAAVLAALVLATTERPAAQARQRITGEAFISEGIPKMPKTPAGDKVFKENKGYGAASGNFGRGQPAAGPGESNDPFITCDPLGFPRNLLAHAITARGGTLFGSAPNRILIAYEQQRVWREIWMDGRALPKAVDVKGAPESRFYGHSVGHWENDNTLVIETTGLDERTWLDEQGHP